MLTIIFLLFFFLQHHSFCRWSGSNDKVNVVNHQGVLLVNMCLMYAQLNDFGGEKNKIAATSVSLLLSLIIELLSLRAGKRPGVPSFFSDIPQHLKLVNYKGYIFIKGVNKVNLSASCLISLSLLLILLLWSDAKSYLTSGCFTFILSHLILPFTNLW